MSMEGTMKECQTFSDKDGAAVRVLHIMTFGCHRAGKSSLVNRFVGHSTKHYYPTIGAEYKNKTVRVDDCNVKLRVFDLSAGKAVWECPPPQPMVRSAHAVLLVFDVTSLESFDVMKKHALSLRAEKWKTQHKFYCDTKELPCIVVGSKCDLVGHRLVPSSVAQEFATGMGLMYLETSAETGDNVELVYITAAALALEKCKSNRD